jgi:hypothetical protein
MSARERGRDGRVDQGEKGRKRRGEVNSRALEAGALEAGAFWPVVCKNEGREGEGQQARRARREGRKLDLRKRA